MSANHKIADKKTTVKRTAASIIFGRTSIFVITLLIQLAFIVGAAVFLNNYLLHLYGLQAAAVFLLMVHEVNRDTNPMYKLCWIMVISLVPIFGIIMYLYVRCEPAPKKIHMRHAELINQTSDLLRQNEQAMNELRDTNSDVANLYGYIFKYGAMPVSRNNHVSYFPLGDDMFPVVLEELKKAEKFIFIESFIICRGIFWNEVLKILKEKAASGVEVRVMYDGMGCMALLPKDYADILYNQFGIKCKVFAPIQAIVSTYQNNRDHRKIIIIDGKTGFNGGINLADEYINQKERFGHWKDTAVMVKGDAARNYTLMFLQMWNISENKNFPNDNMSDFRKYVFVKTDIFPDKGFVVPYSDSPLDNIRIGEDVYIHMANIAKKQLHIMTPYLIPDFTLIHAITFAAMRGVEVTIITPGIPDKKYAYALTRSYYRELIDAGVNIYEYTPGFVHAKVCVADGVCASVGTINYDYRSLFLHFECATNIYNSPAIADIENDFQQTLHKCRKISRESCKLFPLTQRISGKMLRLIAPLM